ncbi:GTP-binding protein [Phaffia rhodozyma]|uniref:GTP-binding protein n=1 Tax=Phaffia rhodozyma TaxID=264483 RepID=A0A0F7SJQ1_PHARH|nr:GTP-binding protein [Phaffia rhodozyma]
MRQVIFSAEYRPVDTGRLGATVDVESTNVRLFNNLHLNVWDCGGQDSYMDNYLFSSAANTFTNVAICVYVFDTKSEEWDKDVEYFESVLDNLRQYSGTSNAESDDEDADGEAGTKKVDPDSLPGVCILINKMDLEDPSERARIEREKRDDLTKKVKARLGGKVMAFGTSIWDESLYKAWSAIIRTLIPNSQRLVAHLSRLCDKAHGAEAVLFERQTFLVVARSRPIPPRVKLDGQLKRPKRIHAEDWSVVGEEESSNPIDGTVGAWEESETDVGEKKRYEKISEMIRSFRHILNKRIESRWTSWQSNFANCSVAIDEFTSSTYCLILSNDKLAKADFLLGTMKAAQPHFEELSKGTVLLKCPICRTDSGIVYLGESSDDSHSNSNGTGALGLQLSHATIED